MFTAEFFNPDQWADLFKRSGAKYVVLTTKHHEGFALFPSRQSFCWNSVDTGPHRDIVRELSDAVRDKGLTFGVYYSLHEWFNPSYLDDKKNAFTTRNYSVSKVWPDLKQLIYDYRPSVLWADGDWEAEPSYWRSTLFLAWLYNESPVRYDVVVNDRWGKGTTCSRGDFYNCHDRFNPGILMKHKWENVLSIDKKSWGYRRNMELQDIMTMEELLNQVVSTVSCGGNALINIGPTKEGTISPIFQERLTSLGAWLDINGPGIYGTSPWTTQNDTHDPKIWYTCIKLGYNERWPTFEPKSSDVITAIYAIVLQWPANNVLKALNLVPILRAGNHEIKLLGNEDQPLKWQILDNVAHIQFPEKSKVKSKYAWTLKVTLIKK